MPWLLVQVRRQLRGAKLHVDVDTSDRTMQKKVREAQLSQYNYIFVIGEQEKVSYRHARQLLCGVDEQGVCWLIVSGRQQTIDDRYHMYLACRRCLSSEASTVAARAFAAAQHMLGSERLEIHTALVACTCAE